MEHGDEGGLSVTGAEIGVIARVLSAVRKVKKRPEPVEVLKYRERTRQLIREKLEWPDRGVPDIIVIRLSKKDKYPQQTDSSSDCSAPRRGSSMRSSASMTET